MNGLVQQVLGSLEKKHAVVIQGSSAIGKSETMMLLKCLLEKKGKRPIYLDMRRIKDSFQFRGEILNQLGIEGTSKEKVYSELVKGNVPLLFDEYWAGAAIASSIVKFAYDSGNDIVAVAGSPLGMEFDEYILK